MLENIPVLLKLNCRQHYQYATEAVYNSPLLTVANTWTQSDTEKKGSGLDICNLWPHNHVPGR